MTVRHIPTYENEHPEKLGEKMPAADPAQSAPSAREFKLANADEYVMVGEIGMQFAEAYAALRTAQLASQLARTEECFDKTAFALTKLQLKQGELLTRAETAESALRDAKNAIDASGHLTTCQFNGCTCGSTEKYIELRTEFMRKWRFTVAAQTPEEK